MPEEIQRHVSTAISMLTKIFMKNTHFNQNTFIYQYHRKFSAFSPTFIYKSFLYLQ